MGLVFKRKEVSEDRIMLAVFKVGYPKPFTSGLCFNREHADAVVKHLTAWASQGWPYEPKDV